MKEQRYGFIDKTGKFVIEPKFVEARGFSEGLACVSLDGKKYGYIDKTGRFVVPPKFDGANYKFSEGLAYVVYNGKAGFIDKTGRFIIEPKFDHKFILPGFHEGLAPMHSGSKMGYINKLGQFVIAPKYWSAGPFYEGIARVDGGFIDKRGHFIESKFRTIGYYQEGLLIAEYGNKYGYIDKTQQFVVEPIFESAGPFNNGLAPVQYSGKWGYINKTGRFVIKPIFEIACLFNNDLAFVQYGGKLGCIDKTGQLLIEPEFENIKSTFGFSEGLAPVRCGDKEGFIDKTGNFVIKPIYDYVGDFHEGLAWVTTIKKEMQTPPLQPIIHNTSSPQQKPAMPPTKEPSTTSQQAKRTSSSGCYIATAVYGSYDCPEVWTLRRYRDNVLDSSWYGRLFIRTYYAVSPTLVKCFGDSEWFRNIFHTPLNRWVKKLNEQGFENEPYNDKY